MSNCFSQESKEGETRAELPKIDREELCIIQEHFESILDEIFSSVPREPSWGAELQTLLAETTMMLSWDVMQAVHAAIRGTVTPANVSKFAIWAARLLAPTADVPNLGQQEVLHFLELEAAD